MQNLTPLAPPATRTQLQSPDRQFWSPPRRRGPGPAL